MILLVEDRPYTIADSNDAIIGAIVHMRLEGFSFGSLRAPALTLMEQLRFSVEAQRRIREFEVH